MGFNGFMNGAYITDRMLNILLDSFMGKMTGKRYGPTEMIVRALPGWLARLAGG